MRFLRRFFRHIHSGFRQLFRNGWMTTASVVTMALTLFMVGSLAFILGNVQKVTENIESQYQVRAMIDLIATEEDEAELQQAIEKIPHVSSIEYRTKDEELEAVIENYGEEFKFFEGDTNPLTNVFEIQVDSVGKIQEVADQVSELPHVQEASYGGLLAENLLKRLDEVRYVFALVGAIFVVLAVLLISNTIRLTISARQHEIEIMRLVGATNGYIRAPFVYEGMFIGVLSGLVASGFLYGVYETVKKHAFELFGVDPSAFLPTFPILGYIAGGITLLGIFLGMFGVMRAMQRYLKI